MDIRKRIYVAGSYSADNVIDVLNNIKKGNQMAADLMKMGFAPFSPWLDHQFQFYENLSLQDYYDYSIAWLIVSDAMLVLPGYENSKGTLKEIEIAEYEEIPVYYDVNKLLAAFPLF